MISTTYFAVCPTAELIHELRRLNLDDQRAESALYSERIFDREQTPIAQRVAKVKGVFLAMFCEFLAENRISPTPFQDQFDKYWQIHVFPYCEDVEEVIADLARTTKTTNPEWQSGSR